MINTYIKSHVFLHHATFFQLNFHKLVYQTIQYLNYFDQLSLSAVQMNVWSLEQPSAVHLTAINKLKFTTNTFCKQN